MDEYKEMIKLVKASRKLCPWNKEQSIESYKKQFFSEVEEVKHALKKKDYQNLKEELGDVIWDAMMIAHIAEEQGHFKAKDVIRDVNEKFKRRKPYIVEGRRVTLAEAKRIWRDVKEQEKKKK